MRGLILIFLLVVVLTVTSVGQVLSANPSETEFSEISKLREEIRLLRENYERQLEELKASYERRIKLLEERLKRVEEEKYLAKDSQRLKEEVKEEVLEEIQPVISSSVRTFPSMFNPAVSLTIDTMAKYYSNEGRDNSFDLRSAELMLSGSVDPFLSAYAVILGTEEDVELHEAAGVVRLPMGFSLKGGKFFADFGHLAKVHEHDLPFVDRPPSLKAYLGGEPIVTGVELGWLVPIERYLHLTLGIYDEFEGHSHDEGHHHEANSHIHRSTDDFAYLARISTGFDPFPDHNFRLGATYLRFDTQDRQTYAFDFKYTWFPLSKAHYQRLDFGMEVLFNRIRFAHEAHEEEAHVQHAWGGYAYLEYKFSPKWSLGFRYDQFQYLNNKNNEYTYTPYLTFSPSERHRWRFQYNYRKLGHKLYDDRSYAHEVFLQWTFTLGSHKHPFQY
ncbi:hypothetical protein [Thermosulfurimonas dismutans]|uniref:Zinc-regulated TonB-dependent outer membrane receptor n=1 Tax=Thermosulfurimonas dismutans TaxID=999894 RepID=A0A179D203_9BACT|nr:hypothetical protein [Thermosulfurimonas dismutans]OAQ20080.1 Zinc-regulated TonB-dependent outer membrane receptor [Thermosulfurimonas dismutans]